MAKQTVGVRLEPKDIEELKARAEKSNKKLTDIITETLFEQKPAIELERQNEELKQQIAELQTRFERATGRKPKFERRTTIRLTEQEHQALTAAANANNMSKPALIRKMLTGTKNPVFAKPPPLDITVEQADHAKDAA